MVSKHYRVRQYCLPLPKASALEIEHEHDKLRGRHLIESLRLADLLQASPPIVLQAAVPPERRRLLGA